MDRRHEDRDRRSREGSWGRDDAWRDQHDRERSRYRQDDEYLHGHEHGGGYGSREELDRGRDDRSRGERSWSDRGRDDRGAWDRRPGRGGWNERGSGDRGGYESRREESPLHGRYQYGPEEDRGMWGTPRPGDGEGYSRVGDGPRRDEPYRSPSRSEEYGMFREGNHSGYDTWHGHNYFQNHNDAAAMGSAPINAFQRSGDERGPDRGRFDDRRQREERGRYDDRGRRETTGRFDERARRDEWERRADYGRQQEPRRDERGGERGGGERGDERGGERGGGERDISRSWRMMDSWGDTDYSRQRGQGIGWHRGDDYGDRFWSFSERSRDD